MPTPCAACRSLPLVTGFSPVALVAIVVVVAPGARGQTQSTPFDQPLPDAFGSMGLFRDWFHWPTYVICFRDAGRRRQIASRLAEHGLVNVIFEDAVDAKNATEIAPFLEGRSFDHIVCPKRRAYALKKVAMWAARQRVTKRIAASGTNGLLLEDDVYFPYEPFPVHANALIESLAKSGRIWDVIFLGHCFERVEEITDCTKVHGHNVWFARAQEAVCTHALFFSVDGARRAYVLLQGWGRTFHKATEEAMSNLPKSCGHMEQALKFHAHRKDLLTLTRGADNALRALGERGALFTYEAWPVLVQQSVHKNHRMWTYAGRRPKPCLSTP